MTMPVAIDAEHLNVVRGARTVLHDISLRIESGEQVALLGPNGCGKSTLLKTILCELRPVAAADTTLLLFGRERWDLLELKRRLGVVQNELPGKPMLAMTGRDAVLTGYFSSSTLWPHLRVTEVMRDRTEEVMKRTGAAALGDKRFGEMSAGQQRRILIARALVASADCLLLDEPSNALDLTAQRALREILSELAAAHTTILHITHHVSDLIPAMQRVVLMKDGRIVGDGQRADLLTQSSLCELFEDEIHLAEYDGILHAW